MKKARGLGLGAWMGLAWGGLLLGTAACSADALGELDGSLDTLGELDGSLDTGELATAEITVSVRALLAALFPSLTAAELDELSASLDLEAALALKTEIESIRETAEALGRALFMSAEERVEERQTTLAEHNQAFPVGLSPLAATAFQDRAQGRAYLELGGVLSDRTPVLLADGELKVTVNGELVAHELDCLHQGTPVDIVFLVDVTGSMSPVIDAVRRSLRAFVDAIAASGVTGTLGVVTFQDSVGVNVSFQEPSDGVERSPFFTPVPIDDADGIQALQRFIARLEADSGRDAPENLTGAVDFANTGIIGYSADGAPNRIGDGREDPPGTAAWPPLGAARRLFVAFTDSTFHADSRTSRNSSLVAGFEPRRIAEVTAALRAAGTVVHVVDPSWVDRSVSPTGAADEVDLDADYWAHATGGVGEDRVAGHSLTDLELVVVSESTGLLDIALQSLVASSCRVALPAVTLTAASSVHLELSHGEQRATEALVPVVF